MQLRACAYCGEKFLPLKPSTKCCSISHGLKLHYKNNMSPTWAGGKRIKDGYVLIYSPDHPSACSRGYVREHRLVMERKIGRLLAAHEQVHHINGRRDDNRPENLELWVRGHPTGIRATDAIKKLFYSLTETERVKVLEELHTLGD